LDRRQRPHHRSVPFQRPDCRHWIRYGAKQRRTPAPLLTSIPNNDLFIRSSSILHCPRSTAVDNGGVYARGDQSASISTRLRPCDSE
jgi:hypothetical protein